MNAAVAPDVEAQGPSVLEAAGGAAGLAAVAIVAWSLAALRDTGGCLSHMRLRSAVCGCRQASTRQTYS